MSDHRTKADELYNNLSRQLIAARTQYGSIEKARAAVEVPIFLDVAAECLEQGRPAEAMSWVSKALRYHDGLDPDLDGEVKVEGGAFSGVGIWR